SNAGCFGAESNGIEPYPLLADQLCIKQRPVQQAILSNHAAYYIIKRKTLLGVFLIRLGYDSLLDTRLYNTLYWQLCQVGYPQCIMRGRLWAVQN
ncbi:MAG: hypothetical protein AAB673_03340, partial [Patescibacteria group bacterium]